MKTTSKTLIGVRVKVVDETDQQAREQFMKHHPGGYTRGDRIFEHNNASALGKWATITRLITRGDTGESLLFPLICVVFANGVEGSFWPEEIAVRIPDWRGLRAVVTKDGEYFRAGMVVEVERVRNPCVKKRAVVRSLRTGDVGYLDLADLRVTSPEAPTSAWTGKPPTRAQLALALRKILDTTKGLPLQVVAGGGAVLAEWKYAERVSAHIDHRDQRMGGRPGQHHERTLAKRRMDELEIYSQRRGEPCVSWAFDQLKKLGVGQVDG